MGVQASSRCHVKGTSQLNSSADVMMTHFVCLVAPTGALANEHLLRARAGASGDSNDPAEPSASASLGALGAQELAQLMKDNPTHWEDLLRCANTDGRLLKNFHK